jgi:CHAT domain-containing protein
VAGADILHLATHADIDETRPELSAIYFSQADAKGKPLDGLLGLYEIYDLNLPFQLAVLSGCRTGLGKDAGGEGLVGFSRAFFYAGSSRVLMSLWRISDEGTALFMREFYRKLMSSGRALFWRGNGGPWLWVRGATDVHQRARTLRGRRLPRPAS